MSREVNLDALIAEAKAVDPIEVTIGADVFKLRPAMPWDAIVAYRADRLHDCLVFCAAEDGERFAEAMTADRPTRDQIVVRINTIYDQDTGESQAS